MGMQPGDSNKNRTTDERTMDVFSELDKRPDYPVTAIRQRVALISTPRCGSTMFCDILRNTGMVGHAEEWLNMRTLGAYSKYMGGDKINLGQYLDFILRKTTSSNGIFAINFHVSQHIDMMKNNFDIFKLGFDKIYYLYRKEKIDQAYSLAKAYLTDQWTTDTVGTREAPAQISRDRVIHSLLHIAQSEEYYSNNIKPVVTREYCYEDFSALDTTNAFTEVLDDLGLADIEPTWKTTLKKQSNHSDRSEVNDIKNYLFPSFIPSS